MRKFPFSTAGSLLRRVFILGVLAGLIFSCAEGIRLLPFPQPGNEDGAGSFGANSAETGHLSYIKSFEGGRGGNISRPKQSPGTHILGGQPSQSPPPFRAGSAVRYISPAFLVFLHRSVSGQRLPDTRGPPVSS